MVKNLIGKGVEAARGAVSVGTAMAGMARSAARSRLHGQHQDDDSSSPSDRGPSAAEAGGSGPSSSQAPGPEGAGPSAVDTGGDTDERNTVAEELQREQVGDPSSEVVVGDATDSDLAAPRPGLETYPSPAMRRGAGDIEDDLREGQDWDMADVRPGGNVDVETPVGTTGAGAAFNPDTAESDLQQPETAPLMDPSLTKQVKSEAETLGKAADPHKE